MSYKIKTHQGFTLAESIIAIVILGIAMVTLTTLLFPQIEDSARPHYEVRASALAHSFMTTILARAYDHNSDPDGGIERCGETDATACNTTYGPDEVNGVTEKAEDFNDVDDYIGCWYTSDESLCPNGTGVGSLTDILGEDISSEYPNFMANVAVVDGSISSSQLKKVTVTITASRYGDYSFVAHRGNF